MSKPLAERRSARGGVVANRLPERVVVPGLCDIQVKRERLPDNIHADFDRETHVLRVCDSLVGVDAHVAFLHEILHVMETLLPRSDGRRACRIPHQILDRGDAVLLALLVESGLWRGVSRAAMAKWRKKNP